MSGWRQLVRGAVGDAEELLRARGYPTDPGRIKGKAAYPVVMATRILHWARELETAVAAGDINRALNVQSYLLTDWNEMDLAVDDLPVGAVSARLSSDIKDGSERRKGRAAGLRNSLETRARQKDDTGDRIVDEYHKLIADEVPERSVVKKIAHGLGYSDTLVRTTLDVRGLKKKKPRIPKSK
jgi:hypothetical protein